MLKQLFSRAPKWQSPKSQKRIEALAELDLAQEKDAGILLKLAREDSEPAVRRAAVALLTDVDAINQIQKRDLEAQVRDAATARLHDLLAGKVPGLDLPQRLAQLQRITAPQTLIHLIREADAMELRIAAIARLDDEIYLDDIARNSSIAKLRLAAAERISTPSLLEALAEASKNKDKNVYKVLRARLDEQSRGQREAQLLEEKCSALCAAMEAHARSAMNPLYAAKAESLRQQWQELSGRASAAATERFETALALALAQIEELQAAELREANAAQARVELQECVDTLEATLAEYQGQDDFDLPALSALSKTQRLRWELATQLQPAPEAQARRQAAASAKLEQLAEMLLQWQQDKLMVEASLARLEQAEAEEKQALLQALNDVRRNYSQHGFALPRLLQSIPGLAPTAPVTVQKPRTDKTEERQQLKTLLDAIAASIDAGNSRDASKKLRRAQELAREHHLHDVRLNELGERVRELKSWAGFAVQPKKEALLEKMRALITHEMEPDDKADAIHALQEEWKALGVADASVEQPLWEQFKALGDQAYEPCRAHFAAQREMREQNLKKRSELCEQLQSYADALPASPDWKKHEAIIRTARQEWQRYQPSDRQKTRPLQDRFNALLKALEDKHRDVQKKNEAAKQQLVQRAQQLQELEDSRSACDQAKALQQEWKAIGAGSYKTDQRLWQEFRAASDALFAKRDGEFKARQEARDALTQQAGELIQSMQQLAVSADVKALGSEAARLEEAFQALELPRDKGDSLRRQFDAARKQFENAAREQAHQARVRAQSEKVEQWMARGAETGDGIALQDEKAAQLLLDLEILLEIPAQPELQEARRARQMQRLQSQGLRKQSGEQQNLLDELLQTAPLSNAALPGFAERLRVILGKS